MPRQAAAPAAPRLGEWEEAAGVTCPSAYSDYRGTSEFFEESVIRSGFGCPLVVEHRRSIKVDEYCCGLRDDQACCHTMCECPLKKTVDSIKRVCDKSRNANVTRLVLLISAEIVIYEGRTDN